MFVRKFYHSTNLKNIFMTKLLKRSHFEVVNSHAVEYPTPINLNNFWNFGALAGICLGVQILTWVFLAMHYTPRV